MDALLGTVPNAIPGEFINIEEEIDETELDVTDPLKLAAEKRLEDALGIGDDQIAQTKKVEKKLPGKKGNAKNLKTKGKKLKSTTKESKIDEKLEEAIQEAGPLDAEKSGESAQSYLQTNAETDMEEAQEEIVWDFELDISGLMI